MSLRVLIVGGGGREHALAWKVAQSPLVNEVLVAPGNAGTSTEPKTRNVPIPADDIAALLQFAREARPDLSIIGPEQPLVGGLVDRFEDAGLRCFGPRAAAARLEGSKLYAKQFLERHGIPTAKYGSFTDLAAAREYLDQCGLPVVVKADGLAGGKGVVIAETRAAAEQALEAMLGMSVFGAAGSTVVVEEFLSGEEASFIALVDGASVLPLATSQDHKRRDDGDQGPNTGGMGAYSPAPVVTPEIHTRIMREIMLPTVRGLLAEGIHYRGFLYAGLMIDPQGAARVLEYNCRFGDPETQPILCRLRSDLVALIMQACEGQLQQAEALWDPRAAVGVVMASGGYPGPYELGKLIDGLPADDGGPVKVFHAGTTLQRGQVVTDGGRVLCVVGLGANVAEARERTYRTVHRIHWEGAFYRSDIGYRALARAPADC